MSVALVTGSAGLIGSEAAKFFANKGLDIIGIDNNMRKSFFGEDACTLWNLSELKSHCPNYAHHDFDLRDNDKLEKLFKQHGRQISVIIHAAAQPSHDWAANEPITDFTVNALATLYLLENFRKYCPQATFIYLSTNKVYGDTPNALPLVETQTRWDISPEHAYYGVGIDESMSIDQTKHSLFGASKASADLMVQEYGRYFNLKTACFRGGCLTGPTHSGTKLHGFLSYLMRCTVYHKPYTVIGYKGKQVRDNIHSYDLVNALWHFYQAPKMGAVYNMGGGPNNSCSVIEAIQACENISGEQLEYDYDACNRAGDHIWWVSDVRRFKQDYPAWDFQYSLDQTLRQIHQATVDSQELVCV